jgi:hypothetical protein
MRLLFWLFCFDDRAPFSKVFAPPPFWLLLLLFFVYHFQLSADAAINKNAVLALANFLLLLRALESKNTNFYKHRLEIITEAQRFPRSR